MCLITKNAVEHTYENHVWDYSQQTIHAGSLLLQEKHQHVFDRTDFLIFQCICLNYVSFIYVTCIQFYHILLIQFAFWGWQLGVFLYYPFITPNLLQPK